MSKEISRHIEIYREQGGSRSECVFNASRTQSLKDLKDVKFRRLFQFNKFNKFNTKRICLRPTLSLQRGTWRPSPVSMSKFLHLVTDRDQDREDRNSDGFVSTVSNFRLPNSSSTCAAQAALQARCAHCDVFNSVVVKPVKPFFQSSITLMIKNSD